MDNSLNSYLPLALQNIHRYNKTKHLTCWMGYADTFIGYHMNCSNLFETYLYPHGVLIGIVSCFLLEVLIRVISMRTNICKSLSLEDSVRWHNKVVSYLHAWVSTVLTIHAMFQEPHTWGDACHSYAPRYELILGLSSGYFIYDLLYFFRHKKVFGNNTSMLIHHMVCVCGILYCVTYRIGLFYNMCLLFTEITTIFLHQQWFMSVLGLKNGRLYQANGLIFWVLFFFCRVVWCFFQNVHLIMLRYQYKHAPVTYRAPIIAPYLLFLLNTYWFVLITIKVLKHRGKSPNASEKLSGVAGSVDESAIENADSGSKNISDKLLEKKRQ